MWYANVVGGPSTPVAKRRRNILFAMTLVVTAVAALLLWDGHREADARLGQLARRHHLVAFALALDFAERLAALDRQHSSDARADVLEREALLDRAMEDAAKLEKDGRLIVLMHQPDRDGFRRTSGAVVHSQALDDALARGDESLILGEDEADALGIGREWGVVGLAQVDDRTGLPPIRLVVASSARGESERVTHDRWRDVISIAGVTLIVLAFGGLVLREQRRELDLAARLERETIERQRNEQLRRADRLATLAALSTGIAHELATPLAVIAGRAEQLQAGLEGDAASTRALRAIDDQVVRMRAVMEGFLALARGQSPAMIPIAPTEPMNEAAGIVRSRFEQNGVELVLTSGKDLPAIACDPRLFVQVLVNLLVNACQASKSGQRVELAVATNGKRVVFTIADEGEGIAPEVLQRVTEPFFTTRTKSGGAGLGLSIVKEIVEQHGGSFHIEPRPTGGTIATVDIPERDNT
ncbi:hypothetical protein BH09MYX1_BH09MYX1_10680 [soil metagenome]